MTNKNISIKYILEDQALDYKKIPNTYQFIKMNPIKFLDLAIEIDSDLIDYDTINSLKNSIRNGESIPYPHFIINSQNKKILSHDGRHRCAACIELGIEVITVIVVHTMNDNIDRIINPIIHHSELIAQDSYEKTDQLFKNINKLFSIQ